MTAGAVLAIQRLGGTKLLRQVGQFYSAVYTFTVNNTGGVIKAYKDGELVDTDIDFTYGTGINSGFKLGCNTDAGTGLLYGMIDDVKIYNYARTTEQVANDYLAVKGGWVCNNEGTADLNYDFNHDCQVDLADFAMLAADWLNSNRIYTPYASELSMRNLSMEDSELFGGILHFSAKEK